MITPTHGQLTRRHQEGDNDECLREELAECFQALLGEPPLRMPLTDTPCFLQKAQHGPQPIPQPREQEPQQCPPAQPDTLQLRATSGLMAGLMINAGWQGGRLVIRLTAPSASLARRLCGRSKGLEEALSSLLETQVTMEVTHDN